jgi:hypothetical protein
VVQNGDFVGGVDLEPSSQNIARKVEVHALGCASFEFSDLHGDTVPAYKILNLIEKSHRHVSFLLAIQWLNPKSENVRGIETEAF